MIPIEHFFVVSAALFCLGLIVVITKRNIVVILMGIELLLNGANLNLVAFSRFDPDLLEGQMFSLFVIVVSAAEVAVALAILLKVVDLFKTSNLDEINKLKG